jgi:hypothetical protein
MSQALAPAVWALAALLIVAGAAKLRDPSAATRALREAGIPANGTLMRGAGMAEVAVGAWCLVAPSTGSVALLALAYVVFAGAVSRMHQAGVGDCGCFGERSFAPGPAHLALDLCAAVIALVAVVAPPPAIDTVTDRPPLEAVALAAGLACAVLLSYLAFTVMPSAWSAYRGTWEGR